MKTIHASFVLVVVSSTIAVIMDPSQPKNNNNNNNNDQQQQQSQEPRTFNEAMQTCFVKHNGGTLECVNRGALTALQSWNDDECLDFGGVTLERTEGESRSILDLDWDPKDFGNVLRAASRMLERRNMKWDLGTIYPGLQMRVGPTLTGNGVLEFVMDERSGAHHHHYHNRQLGTGRLLVRQLLLPFLLGFKFNLASLLPLLFGALIVITKKALILTKIALLIAGFLGWNSLVSGNQGSTLFGFGNGASFAHGYSHSDAPQYSGELGATIIQNPNYQPYRAAPQPPEPAGFPFGQHVIREIVNVYETANQEASEHDRRKKAFVWRNES